MRGARARRRRACVKSDETAITERSTVPCPDEQTLAMLVARRLPPAARATVETHVASCPACDDALRVLVELWVPDDSTIADTVATEIAAGPALEIQRGATLGRFLVIEELGRGGMGVVVAAYDPELDRKVAIKVLRPDRIGAPGELGARLRREAQVMARLVHPNVVTVLEVGVDERSLEPRLFVAMEYVEGTTLRGWLAARPRSLAEILRVFADAGRGLAAAHTAGIVHRDFKPDNVLVDRDGHPRVTDFGLARAFGEVAEGREPSAGTSSSELLTGNLTETHAIVGTPSYMAPEQIDERDVGPAADQFAWFVALHEAVFGTRPFPETSLQRRFVAIRDGAIGQTASARKVPSRLRAAIRRGLAFDPGARFPDMHAAVRAVVHSRRSRLTGSLLLSLPVAAAAVVLALSPSRSTSIAACPDPDAELRGVWDREVEGRVRQRYAAVLPAGDEPVESIVTVLSERAQAWRVAMTEVCAERVPGEPMPPEVAVRADCLRRRRVELDAFVQGLLRADEAGLRGAYGAWRELPDIETCERPSRYLTEEHVLVDPSLRPEIDAVRDELVRAHALGVAGRPLEERDTLLAAVERAREVGHPPVLAEALVALGRAHADLAERDEARASLAEALRLAVAHRHHDVAARALLATMREREQAGDHDEARRLADLALGHVEALGGNDELRRDVLLNAGYSERSRGDLEAARALWDEAASLGSEPIDQLVDAINLAILAADLGHWGAAEEAFGLASGLAPQIYGEVHAATAMMRWNHASSLCGLGREDRALEEYARAGEAYRALYGDAHPMLAELDIVVSSCLRDAGRWDDAGERLRLARARLGDRAAAPELDDLDAGELELDARSAEVDGVLARLEVLARRIAEHEGGEGSNVAELRHRVGSVLRRRGACEEAVPLLSAALEDHEGRLGRHVPATAVVRAELGLALLRIDPVRAREEIDLALEDLRPEHGHPSVRRDALLGRASLGEAG
jgi:tetratricopeptide (TPR) repeat protein